MSAMLQPHCPDVITKNLAFNVVEDKRRVRLSTNFLSVTGLGFSLLASWYRKRLLVYGC